MGIRLFSYFYLNKVFSNASPPFFIVCPLPFNTIRCSLTPANRPSKYFNRHSTPLRHTLILILPLLFWGPRVVVSTAAFHARVRGSVPGLGGLKETKLFLPHPRVKVSIVGSLRDREVACSASDRQGSNFESCVWRTVSSQSSHHPQEVLLAQFSLYVHKGGLQPDSFHFVSPPSHFRQKHYHIYNFLRLLMPRCRALALPRRSLTPPIAL